MKLLRVLLLNLCLYATQVLVRYQVQALTLHKPQIYSPFNEYLVINMCKMTLIFFNLSHNYLRKCSNAYVGIFGCMDVI